MEAPFQRQSVDRQALYKNNKCLGVLLFYRTVLNYSTCNVFCVTVQLCGDFTRLHEITKYNIVTLVAFILHEFIEFYDNL